jgi:hypothetical protein
MPAPDSELIATLQKTFLTTDFKVLHAKQTDA